MPVFQKQITGKTIKKYPFSQEGKNSSSHKTERKPEAGKADQKDPLI